MQIFWQIISSLPDYIYQFSDIFCLYFFADTVVCFEYRVKILHRVWGRWECWKCFGYAGGRSDSKDILYKKVKNRQKTAREENWDPGIHSWWNQTPKVWVLHLTAAAGQLQMETCLWWGQMETLVTRWAWILHLVLMSGCCKKVEWLVFASAAAAWWSWCLQINRSPTWKHK